MPRWSNPQFAPELKAFLSKRLTGATTLYLLLDPFRALIAQSVTQGLPLNDTLGRFDNQHLHNIVHELYQRGRKPW